MRQTFVINNSINETWLSTEKGVVIKTLNHWQSYSWHISPKLPKSIDSVVDARRLYKRPTCLMHSVTHEKTLVVKGTTEKNFENAEVTRTF